MKTTEEIYQTLLAAFAQRAGFTPEADCDLAVRLYAAAAELQALGIQSEWVLDQSFPQTATGEELEKHGFLRGIARNPARQASGTLRFSVQEAVEEIQAGDRPAARRGDQQSPRDTETEMRRYMQELHRNRR